MGLKGADAQIWATDTEDATSMSAESMSDVGDGVTFTIDDASKDIFDPSATFAFSDSNGTVSPSDYTIRYAVGAVVFDTAPTAPVTLDSGSYLPKYKVAKGFETSFSLDTQLQDVTTFGDEAPTMQKGMPSASGDFGSYQVVEKNIDATGDDDGPTLREVLFGEETKVGTASVDPNIVFRFEPSASGKTLWSIWVQLGEEQLESAIGDAQSRSFSMEVDDQDAAMTTQTARAIDVLET